MKTKGKNQIKELEICQNKLAQFLNENALLKYMLSEIVDENQEKNFLPVAEHFQNELLLKDEKLKSLSKQINELKLDGLGHEEEIYETKVQNMRKEVLHFQKEYENFSSDFKSKVYKNNAS